MAKLFAWLRNYLRAGDPAWAVRRRMIILLVALGVGCVIYAVGWEREAARASSLWRDAFDFIKWVALTYVGGAVADDALRRRPPPPANPGG